MLSMLEVFLQCVNHALPSHIYHDRQKSKTGNYFNLTVNSQCIDRLFLQDWFHVCPGHLKDRAYCVPEQGQVAADTAAKEAKAKEELEKEREKVIREYLDKKKAREEKRKKKKDSKNDNDKGKDKLKEKDKEKEEKKEQEDEDAEKEKKVKELEDKAKKADEEFGPRVFTLNRATFEQRKSKVIAKEAARQNEERSKNTQKFIRTPGAFPTVPSGDPSKP